MSPRARARLRRAPPAHPGAPASLLGPRGVGVRRLYDDGLVLDVVLHGDDALGDLRRRPRARVRYEPLRAADRGGAVLAGLAEVALAGPPEAPGLRLLPRRVATFLRRAVKRLDKGQIGDL